jgi:putative radical SAM enzyme (TIGR03279 family)
MPLLIKSITSGSLAQKSPIKKGHTIISIDDIPVYDILDLMFHSQKEHFSIAYLDKKGAEKRCEIENHFDKPLGFETELAPCKQCQNNCIFCFIDQMPRGLRPSLYVKDDDFLYSFFYGNFISLTNLAPKDINKIVSQHISPLYVSVHTTNQALHKKIFRYRHDFDVLATLKNLYCHDIEIHAQIVLLPDINDKAELFQTLANLIDMENVSTIGIVPVGLTQYRDGKYTLRKYTVDETAELISQVEFLKTSRQVSHIYLADEFFLQARLPIPDDTYYDGYEQIENGIGMVRKTWENWHLVKKKFLRFLHNTTGSPVFITSVSGIQALHPLLSEMHIALPDKTVKAVVIKNDFLGREVTVSGLLTWRDIRGQLSLSDDEYPVLPSSIFNANMLTLDDVHIDSIVYDIKSKILIVDELFANFEMKS